MLLHIFSTQQPGMLLHTLMHRTAQYQSTQLRMPVLLKSATQTLFSKTLVQRKITKLYFVPIKSGKIQAMLVLYSRVVLPHQNWWKFGYLETQPNIWFILKIWLNSKGGAFKRDWWLSYEPFLVLTWMKLFSWRVSCELVRALPPLSTPLLCACCPPVFYSAWSHACESLTGSWSGMTDWSWTYSLQNYEWKKKPFSS